MSGLLVAAASRLDNMAVPEFHPSLTSQCGDLRHVHAFEQCTRSNGLQ
jgi:hypothetical protein